MAALPAVRQGRASEPVGTLPEWIVRDAIWKQLRPLTRHTLVTIASGCTRDDRGNLIGAQGGRELIERIGCAASTFWKHRRCLISAGFLVRLVRGGPRGGTNYPDTYGIPGAPGSLDAIAARPEFRVLVPAGTGRARVQTVPVDGQATLWHEQRGGTPPAGVHPSASRSANHGIYGNGKKNHGVARANGSGNGRIPHLVPDDLVDTARLISLHRQCAERGIPDVDSSDDSLLRFVAAAERALAVVSREGGDACRLFAGLVYRRQWLFVTQAHEDAAAERIRTFRSGARVREASATTPVRTELSADARIVAAAIQVAARHGDRVDPFEQLCRADMSWTRERWASGVAEIEASRAREAVSRGTGYEGL